MIEITGLLVSTAPGVYMGRPSSNATIALSISELVEQLCGCKILPPQSKQGAPEDYVIKVEADNEGNVSSPFFIGATEIKKLGVYKEYGKIWRVVCEKEKKQDEPKFDQQLAIATLDTSWINRLSSAYGGVYAVAMENREKINEIIEWLMKENRKSRNS